jgi:diguanylate cyclase (GGDEF)-like protein
VSVLPATIGSIIVLVIAALNGTLLGSLSAVQTALLVAAAISGTIYLVGFDLFVAPRARPGTAINWLNALFTSIGLLIITYSIPETLDLYVGALLMLAVLLSAVTAGRGPAYMMIGLTLLGTLAIRIDLFRSLQHWALHLSTAVMAAVSVETVSQLQRLSRVHNRHLETIAEFSRHITSSLDKARVMTSLSAAFQDAVDADTYFVGVREGDEMRLELVYDDGEYFENQRAKLDGSLSSWVLENQRSLFLADLRKEVELPGVRIVLAGKHKTNLSWLGVPMRSRSVDGIIAVGSYRPNAFDRGDLQLLTALAEHAAQALDQAYEHEQLAFRAQLDSLTGIYNHGSFLKILQQHADQAALEGWSLGLIMLDVDHFKLCNDTYGHLVGDQILTTMCGVMQQHVKKSDAVGRWGGEEFAIALPSATAAQLEDIAVRIREAIASLGISTPEGERIPCPTVSQGLAIFPQEAGNLVDLVHLADRRLYVAKRKGRNQIQAADDQQEFVKTQATSEDATTE